MPETGYATFGMQSPALELLMKDAEQLGHSDRKRVFRYIGSFTEIAAELMRSSLDSGEKQYFLKLHHDHVQAAIMTSQHACFCSMNKNLLLNVVNTRFKQYLDEL